MAALTNAWRTGVAMSIASQSIHLAWGVGAAEWGSTPPQEDVSAAGLVAEVGRRLAALVQYVIPDIGGEILVPVFNDVSGESENKRFSLSQTPTPYLYMRFNFTYSEASSAVIREAAVFVGTQAAEGLPAGMMYLTPDEISSPGMMLAIHHLPVPINRTPNSRQSFEFVLSI